MDMEEARPTSSPFLTIWTRPRETVRALVAESPELHVILLTCLAGIGESLDRASVRSLGDRESLPVIFAMALLWGPLGGLLALWLWSHLIRWTGRWIGGTASREALRTALAWAMVPVVCGLLLWIPELLLFGSDLFTEATPRLDAKPALLVPFLGFLAVEIALAVWTAVLLCNTVAEVQGFRSAWRGLGNLVLACAVFLVALLLLVLPFVIFAT